MLQFICHKIIKRFNSKFFLIVLTLLFNAGSSKAQTTEDSVKATVNSLFRAMKNADTIALQKCFTDNMVLQTIGRTKGGDLTVLTEKKEAFSSSIAKMQAGDADEQIVFETIKIDGPLASVWTPYQFFYKGKFSHCGVNSFQLVRLNGEWKIQYIIDTRRRQGCIE